MKVPRTQIERIQVHAALCRKHGLPRPPCDCTQVWPDCIKRDWRKAQQKKARMK